MTERLRRLRAAVVRCAALVRRARRERELGDEIESHLRLHIDDNIRRGMTPAEARRRALIAFGGVEAAKERCRERSGLPSVEAVWRDVVFGARVLRGDRVYAAIAILTLGAGIGATTALFSLMNAWLLKAVPYRDPAGLVYLGRTNVAFAAARGDISIADFDDWREGSHAFEGIAAFKQYVFGMTGQGEPERVPAQQVTDGFFRLLRVTPALGRDFRPDEHTLGRHTVVILTHEYWRDRFGADPSLIGRALVLDAAPFTVVGVLPRDFTFPAGDRADLWVPLTLSSRDEASRRVRWLNPIARLKPGVTLAQAQADMSTLARTIESVRPDTNRGSGIFVEPLGDAIARRSGSGVVRWLFGVTILILLIACANVMHLQLARATRRTREIAVRLALGAARRRIVRQLLVESLLVAAAAAALGLALALAGVRLIVVILPRLTLDALPHAGRADVDVRVLVFAIAAAMTTAVLSGLAPAIRGSSLDPASGLKGSGARSPAGSGRRVHRWLIAVEVAIATVVLVGAGLLVRSAGRLSAVDPGFEPQHLMSMAVHVPNAKYRTSEEVVFFFDQTLGRIRELPGVLAAGASSQLPFGGYSSGVAFSVAASAGPDAGGTARWAAITPGYFVAMKIPLLAGRFFDGRDRAAAERVAIVNETFARRYLADGPPLGRHVATADLPSLTIVGVVRDVKYWKLDDDVDPEIYEPQAQVADERMNIVVRTSGDPLASAAAVRQRIWSVDPDQPIAEMRRYTQLIDDRYGQARMATRAMAAFAAVALILCVVGIYGVIAHAVAQRTREIGIRVALGAPGTRVSRMLVAETSVAVGAGLIAGIATALVTTRFLTDVLFRISPTDGPTFVSAIAVIASAALAATYVPARQAMRVDPMTALRQD